MLNLVARSDSQLLVEMPARDLSHPVRQFLDRLDEIAGNLDAAVDHHIKQPRQQNQRNYHQRREQIADAVFEIVHLQLYVAARLLRRRNHVLGRNHRAQTPALNVDRRKRNKIFRAVYIDKLHALLARRHPLDQRAQIFALGKIPVGARLENAALLRRQQRITRAVDYKIDFGGARYPVDRQIVKRIDVVADRHHARNARRVVIRHHAIDRGITVGADVQIRVSQVAGIDRGAIPRALARHKIIHKFVGENHGISLAAVDIDANDVIIPRADQQRSLVAGVKIIRHDFETVGDVGGKRDLVFDGEVAILIERSTAKDVDLAGINRSNARIGQLDRRIILRRR